MGDWGESDKLAVTLICITAIRQFGQAYRSVGSIPARLVPKAGTVIPARLDPVRFRDSPHPSIAMRSK